MNSYTGILLAAGSSRRFGRDKRHHPLPNGDGMAVHSAKRLRSVLDDVVVVLKPSDEGLAVQMHQAGCRLAFNPDHPKGLGSSIRCAVQASQQSRGWLVMPADLPGLRPATIQAVMHRLMLQDGIIVVPSCQGNPGHPVGFSAFFQDALLNLADAGNGRQIMQQAPDAVVWLAVEDAGIYQDVDFVGDTYWMVSG